MIIPVTADESLQPGTFRIDNGVVTAAPDAVESVRVLLNASREDLERVMRMTEGDSNA